MKNPASDAVKKHVTPEIHEHAVDLALKRELRPKTMTMYANIGSSGSQLYYNKKYLQLHTVLKNIFTTAYYLVKKQETICRLSKVVRPKKIEWSRGSERIPN